MLAVRLACRRANLSRSAHFNTGCRARFDLVENARRLLPSVIREILELRLYARGSRLRRSWLLAMTEAVNEALHLRKGEFRRVTLATKMLITVVMP